MHCIIKNWSSPWIAQSF